MWKSRILVLQQWDYKLRCRQNLHLEHESSHNNTKPCRAHSCDEGQGNTMSVNNYFKIKDIRSTVLSRSDICKLELGALKPQILANVGYRSALFTPLFYWISFNLIVFVRVWKGYVVNQIIIRHVNIT
jgi:hypothetical protein